MRLRTFSSFPISHFVLLGFVYLLTNQSSAALTQQTDTPQTKPVVIQDKVLEELREVVKSTVLPPGFLRDLAGLQGTPIKDISGLRDAIAADLRKMGLALSAPSGEQEQPNRYALLHFRQVVSDTSDFRNVESVTFQVRVYPDHGRAEEAFVVEAMGSSLIAKPGSPDRSAVGEASFYLALDPQLQITVYVLRRNVVYEVGCGGIKREPKDPKEKLGPMERFPMPDLPARCTDLAKVVDQWLRNAE